MQAEGGITALLMAWRDGDPDASDQLFPVVYDELRRIAHKHLRFERAGHTLDTTVLVHEAYLKVVDQSRVSFSGFPSWGPAAPASPRR